MYHKSPWSFADARWLIYLLLCLITVNNVHIHSVVNQLMEKFSRSFFGLHKYKDRGLNSLQKPNSPDWIEANNHLLSTFAYFYHSVWYQSAYDICKHFLLFQMWTLLKELITQQFGLPLLWCHELPVIFLILFPQTLVPALLLL